MKFFSAVLLVFLFSCSETQQQKVIREGKALAQTHCSSCHQFPEPGLLNKSTWVFHVLPKMGALLGFRHFETTSYFENDHAEQKMSLEQWEKIVHYYVALSPDTPKVNSTVPIDTSLSLFRAQIPAFSVRPPLTSFIGIFPGNNIWFADGITKRLYTTTAGKLLDSFELETGISQVVPTDSGTWVLSMGVMYPSDAHAGKLTLLRDSGKNVLIDSLQRPVHIAFSDLNSDGRVDAIISEFGNNTGALSWFEKTTEGYQKHILKPLAGAVKAMVRDFNKDGRNDILALMAQADEGLSIFYNEGENRFREQRILRFPPAYGCNYFDLADMDGDGDEDIVLTNGDNGDYPPILKYYHGVRIYLADEGNKFQEKIFLPVNGACKAVARDFDNDGDVDLASIAYFPDYAHRPLEGFIFWENKGELTFEPHSSASALKGRWLVMEAGDTDGDGDDDIVLGSARMAMGAVPDSLLKKWDAESPSMMILENTRTDD